MHRVHYNDLTLPDTLFFPHISQIKEVSTLAILLTVVIGINPSASESVLTD
jgi:hypothetical protein